MREYNPIQGRWWTPDPAGLAAVDPNNPQSWNRFAYGGGTPLEATDPLGLLTHCPVDPVSGEPVCPDPDPGNPGGGPAGGVGGSNGGKPSCLPTEFVFGGLYLPMCDGGGGAHGPRPRPSPPSPPPAPPPRPAWLNNITSIFGYDQNNPLPSCLVSVFGATVANDNNPLVPGPTDAANAGAQVASAAVFNKALNYAATRELTSPYSSSVFRGAIRVSSKVADATGVILVLQFIGTEIHGLEQC